MGIIIQKNDNVVKLLDGLSLLDDQQDQESVIGMLDTLAVADEKVKTTMSFPSKHKKIPAGREI